MLAPPLAPMNRFLYRAFSTVKANAEAAAAKAAEYAPIAVRREQRLAEIPISYRLIDFVTENRKATRQQIYAEVCNPDTSNWTRSEIHKILQRLTQDGLLGIRLSSIRGHGAYYIPTKAGIQYMIDVEKKGAELRKKEGRPDPEPL